MRITNVVEYTYPVYVFSLDIAQSARAHNGKSPEVCGWTDTSQTCKYDRSICVILGAGALGRSLQPRGFKISAIIIYAILIRYFLMHIDNSICKTVQSHDYNYLVIEFGSREWLGIAEEWVEQIIVHIIHDHKTNRNNNVLQHPQSSRWNVAPIIWYLWWNLNLCQPALKLSGKMPEMWL